MNARLIRYSTSGTRSPKDDEPTPQAMDEMTRAAVEQARAVVMTADHWWNILLGFLLGGFTSAIWTWREARRKPAWNEVVSTFFLSGLVAVAFIAYLIPKIDTPMAIFISIMVGFSGEALIRIAVRAFNAVIVRMIGTKGTDVPKNQSE